MSNFWDIKKDKKKPSIGKFKFYAVYVPHTAMHAGTILLKQKENN